MNGKKAKKIRKLAAQLATENKLYLVRKSPRVHTDPLGNRLPYTVDQTVLHPMCQKSAVKFLNKLNKGGEDITSSFVMDLFAVECTAKLSELAADGYRG